MSFKSLHQVLGALEHRESWKGRRQFQLLLSCWFDVVGPAVAAQTRPISIQRRVLQVATSSPVWAQNLAFERCRILEKLNARLPFELTDIRFSTAQWQTGSRLSSIATESVAVWQEHPSRVEDGANAPQAGGPTEAPNSQSAFRNWARAMRSRSQHLPLCSICQCPTPEGELIRWSVCALCAAKQFGHSELRPLQKAEEAEKPETDRGDSS